MFNKLKNLAKRVWHFATDWIHDPGIDLLIGEMFANGAAVTIVGAATVIVAAAAGMYITAGVVAFFVLADLICKYHSAKVFITQMRIQTAMMNMNLGNLFGNAQAA